jgi:hypothetical protein
MVTAKDMVPLKMLLSCEGNPLPLRVNHSGAQIVAKGKILHADIRCLNGFVDEIDTVLLPPGVSLAALAPPPAPPVNNMANPAPPTNDAAAAAATTNSSMSTNVETSTNAPPQ